jgi:hypothetical protein
LSADPASHIAPPTAHCPCPTPLLEDSPLPGHTTLGSSGRIRREPPRPAAERLSVIVVRQAWRSKTARTRDHLTLGALHEVTPTALTRPTPCRGWDLPRVRRARPPTSDALISARTAGPRLRRRSRCRRPQPPASCSAPGQTHRVATRSLTPALPDDRVMSTGALELAVHEWDAARMCGQPRPIPRRWSRRYSTSSRCSSPTPTDPSLGRARPRCAPIQTAGDHLVAGTPTADARVRRRRLHRARPLSQTEARARLTAASTCRRVVGKTGTGLSAWPMSNSISVHPRTTPSAPAATRRSMTAM